MTNPFSKPGPSLYKEKSPQRLRMLPIDTFRTSLEKIIEILAESDENDVS